MINFNIKFKRERGFVTILALGEPLEIFLRYSYKAWTLFKVSAERKYFASDRTEQHKKDTVGHYSDRYTPNKNVALEPRKRAHISRHGAPHALLTRRSRTALTALPQQPWRWRRPRQPCAAPCRRHA